MNITKSSLTVDGNSVHMSMPFAKVDQEKRTVSGYATLNNIDSQGDVVTAEASAKAFARARGNLREMHDKVAVGKVVDFREDEFYHDGEFYRGIFVTAYVSKGAQNTWEKVLDGTLSGFSIGGEINDSSTEFVKEAGKTVRFIKDYDLVELSLVDNPANQLANVFSIEKSATGSVTVKGMAVETKIESVFVCPVDDTIVVKATDSETCPQCSTKMENAGWFESGPDRAEKVHEVLTKFRSPTETEAAPTFTSEGGADMGKQDVAKAAATVEPEPAVEEETTPEVTPEVKPEEVDETAGTEEGEEAAAPEEVEDEETAIEKKLDDLKDAIKDSLEDVKKDTAEKVTALEEKLTDFKKSFESETSELRSALSEVGEKLEATKARIAGLEKSYDAINASDAVKKSADLDDKPVVVQKANKGAFPPGTFSLFG